MSPTTGVRDPSKTSQIRVRPLGQKKGHESNPYLYTGLNPVTLYSLLDDSPKTFSKETRILYFCYFLTKDLQRCRPTLRISRTSTKP